MPSRERGETLAGKRHWTRPNNPNSRLITPVVKVYMLLVMVLSCFTTVATSSKPHIITIVADDLGWNDVSFHGSDQIPTPNIDALAYSGVILNRHYTMATCTPSRAALLTGLHPIKTGMQGFPLRAGEPRGLPLEVPTLPQRLTDLGYVTRMVGKWHIGYHHSTYTPTKRGFLSHFGYWNGYVGYFDHNIKQSISDTNQSLVGYDMHRDMTIVSDVKGRYVTDLFTEEAVRIILAHNSSQPLYLHVAHMAVHTGNDTVPLEVPDPKEAQRKFGYIPNPERRLFAEMLTYLDESVGQIVGALQNSGMLDNCIIVFMSDNGGQTIGLHYNTASNWPLRGMKLTLFEGGVRGVAAVWSPLLKHQCRVSSQLMHITDWLPTLYSAAGGNVTDLGPLDGVDQWPVLYDASVPNPRHEMLLNVDDVLNNWALIGGRWKLIGGSYKDGFYDGYTGDSGHEVWNPKYNVTAIIAKSLNPMLQENDILTLRKEATIACGNMSRSKLETPPCPDFCLFDLIADPCESMDLSEQHPDVVLALKSQLENYREHAVPRLNKPVDPNSNPDHYNGVWVPWMDYTQTHHVEF